MSRSRSHSFTMTLRLVLAPLDVEEILEPALTELDLADPDQNVNAAMDYVLPQGNSEILRQAQRCLLAYIGWLVDDAPARYPSWAKDELGRAMRRLVEMEALAERARPQLH